jgi:hypothetical protein
METTHTRMMRQGWLVVAAVALLASIPFLLPRHASPVAGISIAASGKRSQGANASVNVELKDSPASTDDVGRTSRSSKPTKTRERNPQPTQGAIVAQPALAGAPGNSTAVAARQGRGMRSSTRGQRESRDDGPLVEQQDHGAFHSAGATSSGRTSHLLDGSSRAIAEHTTADASTASASAPAPSQAEPAVTRPPAIPLSHMIDDSVADAVAADVAPQVPPGTMEAIRQTFEQEAGVNELAQDDPDYARRWAKAEPAAAERIRAMYGWSAFDEFQRKLVFEQLEAKKARGGP